MSELAEAMAAIHAAAFARPGEAWSAEAFETLMSQAGIQALVEAHGFVLIRTVADEAEILTLAVRPDARRRGWGQLLVERAVKAARGAGAGRLFLEVAADNEPALGLYGACGFETAGRRPRYYDRGAEPPMDALLLVLNFADGA